MTQHTPIYPFTAIVGQTQLKQALILNAINPAIGGVLIRGEKGTAKSTAVRAIADLLPEIRVVRGCPFGCDPDRSEEWCDVCRGSEKTRRIDWRRIRVVTLPLNATEDRVAGGIDFNQAVKSGMRCFSPGVLAMAHRGILYVDEVNLLDDHIVDVILDAAASGRNRVEREGISIAHASRFILVGTMNPEEGELRPQLLDRFGLCVETASEKEPDLRTELMLRREAFDLDPTEFQIRYEKDNAVVARQIAAGRDLLPQVVLPPHLRGLIAEICTENHVAGHRADLVMEQASRALAALGGRRSVTVDDIRGVSALALVHRRRDVAPPPPPPPPEHDHEHDPPPENDQNEDLENPEEPPQENQQQPQEAQAPPSEENAPPEQDEDNESDAQPEEQNRPDSVMEQIFDVGETFKVKKFASPKDRVFRRGSGRRSRTRIAQKQGRYVKSTMDHKSGDIALDATLRAAAPYQLRRKNGNGVGLAVHLKSEDIREKIREKRVGNVLLFLVDASGSMGARGRMTASKGAIMSLLLDAYQKRDRIAMVSFRKDQAVVNLPPTTSIELAATLLKDMPVGGRTPLSAGLAKSYEVLRNILLREPTARPIVIMITDGKSNMALGEAKPLDEAVLLAERLASDARIRFIVVDTESRGLIRFGMARKLAGAMDADYFQIEDLKADTLINIAKESVQ
ncbi:putative cobaltochelatase [Desulfosarcina ovata]|uniref:Mg-protoporphyrin IX chelatase n=1 Tax=Desulfosarcina ovata subsp. ovata TaxID=2752305 RepID=A0A5K8A9L5_9BACT|nr:putative cobaltochelatase [Desulfosarcina ovata]BBO89148.1 magnesium chelatase [Desulfosarcina ovata subsp. ovata]